MTYEQGLVPATKMAAESPVRFPNESDEYRKARTALLAVLIERLLAHAGELPRG